MRLTVVLTLMLLLTFLVPADAKGRKRTWCKGNETPKTHNCDYLGSGVGG